MQNSENKQSTIDVTSTEGKVISNYVYMYV